MIDAASIKEHAEVIGADGVHVGTVDKVEGDRIKLTKRDSGEGQHEGHHHFLPLSLVAEVKRGDVVRLSRQRGGGGPRCSRKRKAARPRPADARPRAAASHARATGLASVARGAGGAYLRR
jgi:hypothetical protein